MRLYYQEDKNIRLFHGDNKDLLPKVKDKSIRLLFADPPYGILLNYDSPFTDTFEYYEEMTDRLLTDGLRISKTMVVTPGGYTNVEYWKDQCKKRGIEWFRFCWYKGAMPHRSKVGFAHWEEILIFGDMYAGIPDFIYANPESEKEGHPCPKPEKLLSFFIEAYTEEHDMVLDPFAGGGTTLVVAKIMNRKAVGIELSETYAEICAKRLVNTMRLGKPQSEYKQEELFGGADEENGSKSAMG